MRTVRACSFLDGCETWSLTMREENRLRVFKNRLLRGTVGPKRKEVRKGRRKLHDEELNDLFCSYNIAWVIKSRIMRWAGVCSTYGEEVYTGF